MNGPPPFANGPSSFVNGPSSFVNGPSPFVNGPSSFVNGPSSFVNGPSSFVNGPSSFVNGPSPFANGPSPFVNDPSPFDDDPRRGSKLDLSFGKDPLTFMKHRTPFRQFTAAFGGSRAATRAPRWKGGWVGEPCAESEPLIPGSQYQVLHPGETTAPALADPKMR